MGWGGVQGTSVLISLAVWIWLQKKILYDERRVEPAACVGAVSLWVSSRVDTLTSSCVERDSWGSADLGHGDSVCVRGGRGSACRGGRVKLMQV